MNSQLQLNLSELWKKWREYGDYEAYKFLVEHYIKLVDSIAIRMKPNLSNQVTYDELRSHGMLGFLDALNKFDYKRGLQFETYASLRIRGAILDGIRENDWIPRSVREKAKKIEKAYSILEQKYLRSVSDEEIINYLGIDDKEFYRSLGETSFMNIISLDEPLDDEQENSRKDLLADSKNSLDNELNKQYIKDILAKAINKLPEKEKLVVSLYYYEELNLTEISDILNLSTSRISQLHTKAVYRLRGAIGRHKKNLF